MQEKHSGGVWLGSALFEGKGSASSGPFVTRAKSKRGEGALEVAQLSTWLRPTERLHTWWSCCWSQAPWGGSGLGVQRGVWEFSANGAGVSRGEFLYGLEGFAEQVRNTPNYMSFGRGAGAEPG